MANPAGIRFRQAGKIFYYDAGDLELHSSAYVVVETAHGAGGRPRRHRAGPVHRQ